MYSQPPLPEEDYPKNQHEESHISFQLPKDFQLPQIKRSIIPRAVMDTNKDVPTGWTQSVGTDGKSVFTSELTHEQVMKVNQKSVVHMTVNELRTIIT